MNRRPPDLSLGVCLLLLFAARTWAGAAPVSTPTLAPARAVKSPPPDDSWEAGFVRPEKEVSALHQDLLKVEEELKKVQEEIQALQDKITLLRKGTGNEPGLFAEMRLKILLNDLKPRLEWKSLLERQDREKQRVFSQKAFALLSQYNSKIESELNLADSPDLLDEEIRRLQILAKKRAELQKSISLHSEAKEPEQAPVFPKFEYLAPADSSSLKTTLNLLEDRKRELRERLEKIRLQEAEVRNEIKLQEKMRDFVEGIRKINENSNFPRSSLKRNDLENVTGPVQGKNYESRLAEIQDRRVLEEKNLQQVEGFILKIKSRMNGQAKTGEGVP